MAALVKGPKALCELQGYVYDAWLRMAEIYDALGKPAQAAAAARQGRGSCSSSFNEAFWDEDVGLLRLLPGRREEAGAERRLQSRPLPVVGIVPPERAGRVVQRLLAPDMSSGWGIRTLSADHPAYNPHSYQNGSVWPHDNGLIALGFRRYGFADEASRIARDISDAAGYLHAPPDAGALFRPGDAIRPNFPVPVLGANVPQAWAAGSCFGMLQTMLGFQPDAPQRQALSRSVPSRLAPRTDHQGPPRRSPHLRPAL